MSRRLQSLAVWKPICRSPQCPIPEIRRIVEIASVPQGRIMPVPCLRRTAILVYLNLSEQKRIAKGFKDRSKEPGGDVNVPTPAIVKQQVKSVSLAVAHAHYSVHSLFQRRNWRERVVLLTPHPTVAQLLPMEFRPVEDSEEDAECIPRLFQRRKILREDAEREECARSIFRSTPRVNSYTLHDYRSLRPVVRPGRYR
jgi:hypothetical protein